MSFLAVSLAAAAAVVGTPDSGQPHARHPANNRARSCPRLLHRYLDVQLTNEYKAHIDDWLAEYATPASGDQ